MYVCMCGHHKLGPVIRSSGFGSLGDESVHNGVMSACKLLRVRAKAHRLWGPRQIEVALCMCVHVFVLIRC